MAETQPKRGRPPKAPSNPYLVDKFTETRQIEALQVATTVLDAVRARRASSPILAEHINLRLRQSQVWAERVIDQVIEDTVSTTATPAKRDESGPTQ